MVGLTHLTFRNKTLRYSIALYADDMLVPSWTATFAMYRWLHYFDLLWICCTTANPQQARRGVGRTDVGIYFYGLK